MTFWDLFNGSKFYGKRAQYRREYFTKARAIIVGHDLRCQLEDSTQILPLSPEEKKQLATQKNALENLKRTYLAGTLGSFAIKDGEIHLHRKGLRYFTNNLADYHARAETGYAMDLVSPAQIALWITTFIIGTALSYWGGMGIVAALLLNIATTLTTLITTIQKMGVKAAEKALELSTYTAKLTTTLTNERNAKIGGLKALEDGKLAIFQGYANYASGERYTARSAGSETFRPTQPYAPSFNQAPHTPPSPQLIPTDEKTQTRSHYTLAGNAGFMESINPHIPLARIQELENDLIYAQNTLNTHSRKLYEALMEVSEFIGTSAEYSASDYIQAVYDYNFLDKENAYHTYAQSRDFLRNAKAYNYALRFTQLPYSKHLEKTRAKKSKAKLKNPYDAEFAMPEISPAPLPPRTELRNKIQLELYQKLKKEGLDDESACELAYGLPQESLEQKHARRQAYKNQLEKFIRRLDSAKFVRALKSYELLTNHASHIQKIDYKKDTELFTRLQEHFTAAADEMLLHRVLVESNALEGSYMPQLREKALSVWVQFKMFQQGGFLFYGETYGVGLKVICTGDEFRLAYSREWEEYEDYENGFYKDFVKTTEPSKDSVAYELYRARERVWSHIDPNFSITNAEGDSERVEWSYRNTWLYRIAGKSAIVDYATYDGYTHSLELIEAFLQDLGAQSIFTTAKEEFLRTELAKSDF